MVKQSEKLSVLKIIIFLKVILTLNILRKRVIFNTDQFGYVSSCSPTSSCMNHCTKPQNGSMELFKQTLLQKTEYQDSPFLQVFEK